MEKTKGRYVGLVMEHQIYDELKELASISGIGVSTYLRYLAEEQVEAFTAGKEKDDQQRAGHKQSVAR